MTQHEKLIELCDGNGFVCQAEFWKISKSPHKRRDDIARGRYRNGVRHEWEERPCQHGITNSKDFRLVRLAEVSEEITQRGVIVGGPMEYEIYKPGEPLVQPAERLFQPSMAPRELEPPGFADGMRQL